MNCSVQNITRDARKTLDKNEVNIFLIDDIYTISVDAIVGQEILGAVGSVTEAAPTRLLDGGVDFASILDWESGTKGKGMGYISPPDDHMRLIIFQMSDWRRPAITPVEDTDPLYFLQKSKFSGIRGGIDKPICAITAYPIDKVMEFYSCVGGESVTVKMTKYLPFPSIKDEAMDICVGIYTLITYYTAGLVCMTYREKGQGGLLFPVAKDFLK